MAAVIGADSYAWETTYVSVMHSDMSWVSGYDEVVCERYIVQSRNHTRSVHAEKALHVVGALAHACMSRSIPFVQQSSADASMVGPSDLERVNMVRLPEHAKSAAKHLVLYLARNHDPLLDALGKVTPQRRHP